jgi:prepilin-type N-terminal cleavage/methylation domain-containing protein
MRTPKWKTAGTAGFSLIELMIAMTVTLVMLGIASTVLSTGFRIRDREDSVTDAAADAQRALNIMSREIANAGFNLTTNGIVPGDSDSSSIRVRSNLNRYDSTASYDSAHDVIDAGEDIKYFVNTANNTDYLARFDANASGNKTTVLANRLDQIRIHYYDQKVTYSTSDCDITSASASEVSPGAAKYVVLAVCVRIQASGAPGSPGYQPASRVLLVSDVVLRNSILSSY